MLHMQTPKSMPSFFQTTTLKNDSLESGKGQIEKKNTHTVILFFIFFFCLDDIVTFMPLDWKNFQSCFCCNNICELAHWNESQQSHRNKAKGFMAEHPGTLGIPACTSLTETRQPLLPPLIPPPFPNTVRKCSLMSSRLQHTVTLF